MKQLQPTLLWNYFYELTQIPRPSKKEEKVIAYLEQFANQHILNFKKDNAGNVLISKTASTGYENRPTVAMQAHIDMVCEKNNDVVFNFDTDPIQTYIDGDFIRAKGTTLGGDNGIGMAMMLAVLASIDLQHPALECLFTVDEETGLTGAFALENNFLTANRLINLDSEDDGIAYIGCAGGIDTTAKFAFKTEAAPEGYFVFKVSVKGLKGGHSGDDINKGLGNANKILTRYLWQINKTTDLRISTIDGGNLRNALAREASALVLVPYAQKEMVRVMLNHLIADVEREIGAIETNLKITLESDLMPSFVIPKDTSDALLYALYACPHGVIGMSSDMPGLVETSTNLASIKITNNTNNTNNKIITVTTSQRSSVESLKYDIANQVQSVFTLAGAFATHGDGYPGWKPNLNSELLNLTQKAYKNLFNADCEIKAIHAGLECGLFLSKNPGLDMISIGPQMYGVHSPDERLSISSTQKCWEWLIQILKLS